MKKLITGMSVALVAVLAFSWPYGNVGLNVEEPQAQLDVGGTVLVRDTLTVTNKANIVMTDDEGSGGGKIFFDVQGIHGEGIYHMLDAEDDGIGISIGHNTSTGTATRRYLFTREGNLNGLAFWRVLFSDWDGVTIGEFFISTNPPALKLKIGANTYTFSPD